MNGLLKAIVYLAGLVLGASVLYVLMPLALQLISNNSSLMSGYLHPVLGGGGDHLMAMVAVGLLSVQMVQGKDLTAIWLVPLCFVIVLGLGAVLALLSVPVDAIINVAFGWMIPLFNIEASNAVEFVILISLVALGITVMAQSRMPLWGGLLVVGFFALYHGFAHGGEINQYEVVPFFIGFMVASAVAHMFGILIGELGSLFNNPSHARALAGAVLTGAGGYLMLQSFGWI